MKGNDLTVDGKRGVTSVILDDSECVPVPVKFEELGSCLLFIDGQ